jgi:acetylornithine/succinyldiaminopimelate/putrescine aminotransferase
VSLLCYFASTQHTATAYFFLPNTNKGMIILMPPLNITIAEMQEGLNRIELTLQQISGAGQTIQTCSPALQPVPLPHF